MSKNKDLNLKIAQNVRKYRNLKGISHEELEELTGLNYETIVQIETGKLKEVSIQDIETIAETLDVSIDEIIGENEYK
ncbi:MAG: helix-turn-helix transcriptional regulator [Candidatus Pacebacteria bacterium]|nr:helix-turn-helix transcriptional regulator [Candidatus Paceibacterota bacterium]